MDKNELRTQFKDRIAVVNAESRKTQSEALVRALIPYLKNQQGVWTLYSPLGDEPDLLPLLQQCAHIEWVFPKVESKTHMSFRAASTSVAMVSGALGVMEPVSERNPEVAKEKINGCLIPGLAFDEDGYRLGRGGGYYDRFLQNFKGLKLGVTFIEGLTSVALPRESHDQKMNIVISPLRWIDVNQRG